MREKMNVGVIMCVLCGESEGVSVCVTVRVITTF